MDSLHARYPQGSALKDCHLQDQLYLHLPLHFLNSAGKKQSFSAWKYIHFALLMCNDVYFIGCQFSYFFSASAVYAQYRLSNHLKLQLKPRLTATSVIRSPRYYGHFFGRLVKTAIHFLVKKIVVNTAKYFLPIKNILVTVLTGFHCIEIVFSYILTVYCHIRCQI